ncbi:hypothetical protein K438DRAFT_1784549 [Mycena galopus ATCC 62051]|nr:hypothetical protein K438DRAFT_1784549 [Mycena galopus ATCC 62051]
MSIRYHEWDLLYFGLVGFREIVGQYRQVLPGFAQELINKNFRVQSLRAPKSRKFKEPFFRKITFLFGMAGRGHPQKVKRNISGLRNQKSRPPTPEPAPSKPSKPEYSPDWPNESDDESEAEEFDLANEDGMKSDIDVDSDVEVEREGEAFSLATEFLEQLLSQAERRGDDADEEEWVPPRVRYQ